MTPRNRTLAALAALAVAAAAAGCGGSSPSKADFAKKADAICAATNKANPPKSRAPTAADLAEEIKIRTELDGKLRALKVPDSAKADFDAYNAGTKRVIAAIGILRNDVPGSNKQKLAADNAAYVKASSDREKAAIKLGFTTCGRRTPVK
jgi:ABC-type glycerol-3-phosphate transport system substrate-binding protein